jgi:hypothetical protein
VSKVKVGDGQPLLRRRDSSGEEEEEPSPRELTPREGNKLCDPPPPSEASPPSDEGRVSLAFESDSSHRVTAGNPATTAASSHVPVRLPPIQRVLSAFPLQSTKKVFPVTSFVDHDETSAAGGGILV